MNTTAMSAADRLKRVQMRLEEQGVVDVKFFFANTNLALSDAAGQVADALEAYLDGDVVALPPVGDSQKTKAA